MSEEIISALGPGIYGRFTERVVELRNPHVPEWRFEWHQDIAKVYAVDTTKLPQRATAIMHEVRDREEFKRLAGTFLRGWLMGAKPDHPALAAPRFFVPH